MSEEPSSVSNAQAGEDLGRAVIALIHEEPFFGHLLSGINRRLTPQTSRVGMSFRNGRPVLSVNPEYFVNELTVPGQKSAAIKQSVLSLLLDHRGRLSGTDRDPQLFEMASNVVVNQLVGDKWPLPNDSITLDSFDFPLPPDKTVEWYYEQLWDNRDAIPEDMKPEPSDPGDGEGGGEGEQDQSMGLHELSKALRDAKERSGDDFPLLPIEIQDLVESMVDDLQPSVDWRRVIRLFTSSSRRTRISNTLRRPSKRYGTYPGIKVKRLHNLAVIIDTSGSVDMSAFRDFFAEVHGIWRQGSHVTVIEADNEVRSSFEFRGEVPSAARGRGGTNFDPALRWVTNANPPFDAVLYFTDGLAATPTVKTRCEVLWVLPASGDSRNLAGRRIVRLTS